jgi:hypothetical protein
MPRSSINGSYGSPVFSFLMDLPTAFYSGDTDSHSYKQIIRVHLFPASSPKILPLVLLMIAILNAMK